MYLKSHWISETKFFWQKNEQLVRFGPSLIFFNRRTLKFLKMKCNPIKPVALSFWSWRKWCLPLFRLFSKSSNCYPWILPKRNIFPFQPPLVIHYPMDTPNWHQILNSFLVSHPCEIITKVPYIFGSNLTWFTVHEELRHERFIPMLNAHVSVVSLTWLSPFFCSQNRRTGN